MPPTSFPLQVFSIVVFGSIVNEGYVNRVDDSQEHCIFNRNRNACNYGITVGVLAFLSCLLYLALDAYFPQISSVKDRKKAVLSDIGVSGELPGTALLCSSPQGANLDAQLPATEPLSHPLSPILRISQQLSSG